MLQLQPSAKGINPMCEMPMELALFETCLLVRQSETRFWSGRLSVNIVDLLSPTVSCIV